MSDSDSDDNIDDDRPAVEDTARTKQVKGLIYSVLRILHMKLTFTISKCIEVFDGSLKSVKLQSNCGSCRRLELNSKVSDKLSNVTIIISLG